MTKKGKNEMVRIERARARGVERVAAAREARHVQIDATAPIQPMRRDDGARGARRDAAMASTR